jgi:phosphopantothenoylcysteine decarboxylase / phosphopantothenate---cysteine ligase
MGFALAEELANRGADVILISGPVALKHKNQKIRRIDVVSALEMFDHANKFFPDTDGAIMCAAVADYAPVTTFNSKVKRENDNLILELKPNPDIAASLGKIKTNKQILVGFALETDNEQQNALLKLKKKNLDFIVLNSLNDSGAGFKHDTNKISIFDRYNNFQKFELKAKELVAVDIIDKICAMIADNE